MPAQPQSVQFSYILLFGSLREKVIDFTSKIGSNSLEPANRYWFILDTSSAASRLTRPITGPAKNAREYV
jgi:hypothetical protein